MQRELLVDLLGDRIAQEINSDNGETLARLIEVYVKLAGAAAAWQQPGAKDIKIRFVGEAADYAE